MANGQVTRMPDHESQLFNQKSILYNQSKLLMLMTDEYVNEVRSGRRRIESFYKSLNKLSVHDAKSLLYIENALSNKSFENLEYDSDDYKNLLISSLKNWSMPVERYNFLIQCKAQKQIPEKYLEWFKNDLRCSLFLTSFISHLLSAIAYKGRDELMDGITNFIRYDIISFNSNVYTNPSYSKNIAEFGDWRVSCLLSTKSVYLKGRTKNKELKWLDVKNHDQIEWAYSYLDNDKDRSILLQEVFFPENIEEKCELILAHLDTLSDIESPEIETEKNKNFSERSYMLYKMKKAWDGRKNYDSKTQAGEGNIKVYKKNQPKLEAIMTFSGFTANKLINNSIEQMYDQLITDNTDN